jgi:16S rRNA (cytosine1402-N4)-methyltransferase
VFHVAAPPGVPAGPSSYPVAVSAYHVPVLAAAVLRLLGGRGRLVDGTVGGGGHAALLRSAGACLLVIDRDPAALRAAHARLGDDAVRYVPGSFADPEVLAEVAEFRPDGVLLDLGVSSHQLDDDARGFSFRRGVPLDMRMGATGPTAADLLNDLPAPALAQVFRDGADERHAHRLARAVAERRARAPFGVSDDLVNAIRRALGPRAAAPDFARLFQAVRIAVNGELETLASALPALRDALAPGGVLAVISYHSGEDRLVKDAFRAWAKGCRCPPRQPVCTCGQAPRGRVLTRRPVTPDASEVDENPRARSAKLRAFEVTDGG